MQKIALFNLVVKGGGDYYCIIAKKLYLKIEEK